MNEFNPDIKPKFSPSGESGGAVIRWGIIGVGSVTEMKSGLHCYPTRCSCPLCHRSDARRQTGLRRKTHGAESRGMHGNAKSFQGNRDAALGCLLQKVASSIPETKGNDGHRGYRYTAN